MLSQQVNVPSDITVEQFQAQYQLHRADYARDLFTYLRYQSEMSPRSIHDIDDINDEDTCFEAENSRRTVLEPTNLVINHSSSSSEKNEGRVYMCRQVSNPSQRKKKPYPLHRSGAQFIPRSSLPKVMNVVKSSSIDKHTDDKISLDQKIEAVLSTQPLDTLSISKRVFGKNGTKKQVNPTLYKLSREGRIKHHQDGNRHTWSL